ncbi:hypothetical protein [Streptomyces sp. NPDC089919]|uniref:hypothetical protein n=1 Tax=Streptomyces sp. NPDC089919 TaxID=3155188 RepID=UPI00343F44A2
MTYDREHRRLAWCVALLLRHAPDTVVTGLLDRLDPAVRGYLCRDEPLAPSAVTLLLRHGSAEDRRRVAANPHVLGRPLPGLPGVAVYAARPLPPADLRGTVTAELSRLRPAPVPGPDAPPPAPGAADAVRPGDPAEPAPLTSGELVALLRGHGARRPRVPLALLRLPREPLDHELVVREHARRPLPAGSVEALLLVGGLPPEVCARLLDTRTGSSYGPGWHRPAVRAVRTGRLTCDELVAAVAPAHRALLLGALTEPAGRRIRSGLRWDLTEQAAYRAALHRVLAPALGADPLRWAELLRRAPDFPGTLPELAASVAAGPAAGPPTAPAAPAPGPLGEPLRRAVAGLVPPAPAAPAGPERELALAALGVPNAMGDRREDVRWVGACLARELLSGTDVTRHKAPAAWALDEDHWLADLDPWDTFLGDDAPADPAPRTRARALLAARDEADRQLTAALGADVDAWWRAALVLPEFIGPLPELLAGVTEGGSVPGRP